MLSMLRILAVLTTGLFGQISARADEWVSFTGRDGVSIRALMMKPDGGGPFPAIVALHGCAGLGNARGINPRHADWGIRLRSAGFIVLFPESFASRGLGSQCGERQRAVKARDRAGDAFAAAEWLAARPDVDRSRLGLLGWSNGGITLLNATQAGRGPKGVDFARAVAFYPGCTAILKRGYSPRIPVTILHGLADDWTDPASCRQLSGVSFIGYDGAYHDFDHPNLPLRTRKAAFSANGSGVVHIGTDQNARQDAIRRTMTIFRGM
jgi:dienelactone hydrolase